MAFIELIDDGEAAELFERDRAALGYVPNFTRLFAHRPAVYEAWLQLKDAISGSMDLRRYELATVAALRAGRCDEAVRQFLVLLEFGIERDDGPGLVMRCRRGRE